MQPTIKILFTGLLNFYYDPVNKKFEIGALKDDAHCLTIGICKMVSGSVTESKVLTHFEEPDDPNHVEIIDGDRISIDVQKNSPGATPHPDNQLNDPPTEVTDFRHIVCIDGATFHHSPLQPLAHVAQGFPKIIDINDGIFYSELKVPVVKVQGQLEIETLDATWYAGADINLDSAANDFALLKYRKNGVDEEYRMEPAANTNYVIFIENGCHNEIRPPSEYTDFGLYYEVFIIPEPQQFKLKVLPGTDHRILESTLVLNNPIIWYTRKLVWGSYSPLNFGYKELLLEQPGGNVTKVTILLNPDNLCIKGRTLHKYWV